MNKHINGLVGTIIDIESTHDDIIIAKAITKKVTAYRHGMTLNVDHNKILEILLSNNFRLAEETGTKDKGSFTQVWVTVNSVIKLRGWPNVLVNYTTIDMVEVDKVINILKSFSIPTVTHGHVWAIYKSMRGLDVMSLGKIEEPLERGNYEESVLADYDHIVSCMMSSTPCGRLSLLSGPPGTGKSFMIRAMITEVKARFLLASHQMLGQLSGPDVYPLLSDDDAESEGGGKRKPTVLIIEDADEVIKSGRESKGIFEVLNLGDGLFGQMADIRLILTTNSPSIQLDKAIVRPGRMCRHMELAVLHRTHAGKILARLTEKKQTENMFTAPTSLAEVYRTAREDGWTPEVRELRPGQYV